MNRRSLLSLLAAALSAWPFARARAWAQLAPTALGLPPGGATLEALAALILPSELGDEGRAEVLQRFRAWLQGYKPGAELDHGYGHTRLRTTGPAPGASYEAQLAELGRAARGEGKDFAQLDLERRQKLVGASLRAAGVEDLPERPDGRHVAADLMAFFFRSSEANDLCYGVAIERDTCRGLPGSEAAPEPLRPRR